MKKKLPIKIVASLILSVMLFVLPVGAFWGNKTMAVPAFAEETVSGNSAGDDAGENSNEYDIQGDDEVTPSPETKCICDTKCTQYEYNHDCSVCSGDYKNCSYKNPSVKITISTPSGWYAAGSNVKVRFKAEDILDTGNFAIKNVKAKIGQNGSYQDVTEDMYLEISENCVVYVLVTDANDNSYEKSRSIKCFDTTKPTLNAAVSDGLLTIQASDNDSGVKVIYVNGYEFTDVTNGTLNIRLAQFDAGYEYFTVSAMDVAGNMSEIYKIKNPYYKDPESDDDSNPAEQLPVSAEATKSSSATAIVTDHTKTNEEKTALDNEDEDNENTNNGKEFYTIEAASGKVFYLIIDRDDDEEKVYFLTEITENDLLNVTSDNSETLPKNSAAIESQIPITESALPNNNTVINDTQETTSSDETLEEETEEVSGNEQETEIPIEGNALAGYFIIGILGAGVIGTAYYFKVVKKKQDGDFVEDEDDESEYESDETESENDDFFEQEAESDESPE